MQSTTLLPDPNEDIDITHDLVFRPCLHLECAKCMLSISHNAQELKDRCAEDA